MNDKEDTSAATEMAPDTEANRHTFVLRLLEETSRQGNGSRWHSTLVSAKTGHEVRDAAGDLWQLLRRLAPQLFGQMTSTPTGTGNEKK